MGEVVQPAVVVAVAGSIGGNAALPSALRSRVITPVLEEFPVACHEVSAAPASVSEAEVIEAIEGARVVIAETAGASPEVLLSLGWRSGKGMGRTILLMPTAWHGASVNDGALSYPPSARGVGRARDSLRSELRTALVGDRESMAAAASAVLVDVLGGPRRLERLRRIEQASIPLRQPDPLLLALCRAYAGLGAWPDVVRLVREAAAAWGEADPATLPLDFVELYAMALNRDDDGDEALRVAQSCIARGDDSAELRGTLGRIYKDRWDAGGKASIADVNRAIDEYLSGFSIDDNYYPGINALTLMVFSGRGAPRSTSSAAGSGHR